MPSMPLSLRTSPRVVADEDHLDAGHPLEDLVGADGVERGEPVEQRDGDRGRTGGGSASCQAPRWLAGSWNGGAANRRR